MGKKARGLRSAASREAPPSSTLPKGATPEGFRRGRCIADAMDLLRLEDVKGKITFDVTRAHPPGRISGFLARRKELKDRQIKEAAQQLDRTTAGPELVVNASMLIVRLGDESCEFRKSAAFDAMVDLARRPGVAVSGDRFAISRLKKKLRDAELDRIAKAIGSKREGKYALDGSMFGSIEVNDSSG